MNVLGTEISVIRINDGDYISLTDMVRNTENGEFFIHNWMRNRNTIEFLGIWERVYNPNFNPVEFDRIKSQAGLNSYKISVDEDKISKINKRNLHTEIDTGKPVGKEIW